MFACYRIKLGFGLRLSVTRLAALSASEDVRLTRPGPFPFQPCTSMTDDRLMLLTSVTVAAGAVVSRSPFPAGSILGVESNGRRGIGSHASVAFRSRLRHRVYRARKPFAICVTAWGLAYVTPPYEYLNDERSAGMRTYEKCNTGARTCAPSA